MEEADLLKERLQAITEKRRVQDDIAKKRRQIEEEKLKLQCLKKKALREQWLMDGLSPQSEEDQEATKLQAQGDQEQTLLLQSNIDRMETEIEALETQELQISANEEVILKRLKEVERTAEDIIKRATAVASVTDGKELNEGCSNPQNHNPNEPRSFSKAVTMETSEQTEMTSVIAYEKELSLTDSTENKKGLGGTEEEQVCLEADSLESIGKKALLEILADLPASMIDELDGLGNGLCTGNPFRKEALSSHEELNRNESITSSVSDTPSSVDSVYENEAHRKRQDTQELEQPEDTVSNPEDDEDGEDKDTKEIQYGPLENYISDVPEESLLEQYIREEVLSDVSNESCHGLDPDEVDECLRVEIAEASSDDESEDGANKWRAIFSSSINHEDDDDYLDSLQLSAQDLFVQKVEVQNVDNHDDNEEEVQVKIPKEEELEVLEQPDYLTGIAQEVTYNPAALLQSLSKISEDEEGNGNGSRHNTSCKADPNKKLPKDFCVIQETKSENVSTEHVDFQLARKQWREMEEQTKNLVLSPTTKQCGPLMGSHSFMYTPVRNIDRPKTRDTSLENLAMGGAEYPHTQFSPCSEDSGLGDSSYRSPYEEFPETSIEREIRLAMEREDSFKRDRGFSNGTKPTECAQTNAKPVILLPAKLCQEVDEKRKTFESMEDGICNIPRSKTTPSFIITSSPAKGPLKHDLPANSIIILEPEGSPRHGARDTSRANEWHSDETSNANFIILETSNLIIRSASEFCLNTACEQQGQECSSTFLNNPFFKLRSRSQLSLVDEEIKMVKQREEELKKERANIYPKGMYNNTGLVAENLMDSLSFEADAPLKCKSSPSSPMKTAYKMDRSALSCDHRFPEVYGAGGRRKSALALRWEAGEFAE
ncbi:uncharacterized protein palmdb isoform X1 [Oncorhynchus tshawytscha]|uniref:uncharacterized protein palmdb isoform X1 n=2 Tax=Oncorhynchus tshawytscha TaxID=74940 RepID=UPI000D09AE03|nr:uncharacterized protein palmdb isoform X1 [Oncorhynchus tshawytscha]